MRVKELHIIGAVIIQGDTFNDERGHFRELFQKSHFSSVGIQINEAPHECAMCASLRDDFPL